jgi:hexosaminidase
MNKMNVLHWHMTDRDSWPYHSTKFPELSDKGAYCPDCIYSAQEIRRVIQEANDRGIRVVVEVDVPGHSQGTSSLFNALLLFS